MVDTPTLKGALVDLGIAQQAILRTCITLTKLNPLASSIAQYTELQSIAHRITELQREISRLRV